MAAGPGFPSAELVYTLIDMKTRSLRRLALAMALYATAALAQSAPKVTTPKEALGFNLGDDYQMANYTQLEAYWKKLASESDRMKLVSIGQTAEGRPQYMAIITSPENLKNLDHYQEIARRLALAEGLTDEQAHALAREGKAVVWIDGGLHANETVGSQQLMEMVYQMVSRTDPETMRFLNDVILLCVQANPDGQEIVANWYMRENGPRCRRSLNNLPRLYNKYIGHDDNRDFYMSNMPETTNMNRVLFQRVVSADRVQPPPDRAGRRGDLHAAVPRSVQLLLRPAGSAGNRNGGHGHAQPAGGGGQGRQRDAHRLELLHLVERRPAHGHLLPQHDRHAHGDHRQPDADEHSAGAGEAVAAGRLAAAHRAAGSGTTGSPSITT